MYRKYLEALTPGAGVILHNVEAEPDNTGARGGGGPIFPQALGQSPRTRRGPTSVKMAVKMINSRDRRPVAGDLGFTVEANKQLAFGIVESADLSCLKR